MLIKTLKLAFISMFLFILMMVSTCFAHMPADPPHQTYLIGNYVLENEEVINDFSLAYVTHGTLSDDKSNAILVTVSYMGNHHRLDFLIGPGKALDTNKYFIICVDPIGNGFTTSPSNSKTQHGMNFPQFSIRDMVESEYKLLTGHFGIQHLVAVVGASMGGMQTLQWGVSHPDFMDALSALTPEGRCPAWTAGIMDVAIKTIMLDPKWNNGNYTSNPERGVRLRNDLIMLLTASTPDALKEKYPDNGKVFLASMKQGEDAQLAFDANDSIYQARAIINHNLGETSGFNGDYYKALQSIKAKTLLMTAPLDILVPVEEAEEAARYIPNARYIQIPSNQGHFAATAKRSNDVNFMNREIQEFLNSLPSQKHGVTANN